MEGRTEDHCIEEALIKILHASSRDYLKTILVLQEEKGMTRSVDVIQHTEVSRPNVCHAVSALKEGGFLTIDKDFFLHLTDIGWEITKKTYEKHCFFTRLLVDADIEPKTVEWDVYRMGHVINESSFQHLGKNASEEK